ncbi:MAG: DUF4974 domain-containing protein [Tannerellaceae bacterium]|nr:DUF4974 domain-containing protein [Tannerellaceae bacterium]
MREQFNAYFAGTLSPEEKLDLFTALENDPVLLQEFVRLHHMWAIIGMAPLETDDAWSTRKIEEIYRQSRRTKTRRFIFSLLRYAAVVALLITTWFVAGYYQQTGESKTAYTSIEVPKGQRVFVMLPDGSQAWLSSRTRLTYSNRFNQEERTVELDGEAFFTIEKNEQLPFIVSSKEYSVEVTGTKFNVFAYSDNDLFETDLVEGSVLVYKSDDKAQQLQLFPNEQAYLSNGEILKGLSKYVVTQDFSNGIFSFEDRTLQEIVNWLSAWYNIQFEVQQPDMLSYTFSGKFRQSDPIHTVLQAIKETGKFNYRIVTEDKIEIF